jgi:hypothetical protein
MRSWVAEKDSGVQVNFQPESASESHLLDGMLKFTSGISKPISSERDRTVAMGATSIAELGGHETQRWIFIPKIQHPEVKVEVGCSFDGFSLIFAASAGDTLNFMRAMYHRGFENLIDTTVNNIRNNGYPGQWGGTIPSDGLSVS